MLTDFYYTLKPLIPRRLQLAIRRWLIAGSLRKHENVWPINVAAGDKPDWFKGWPDGKKFALLITHDVETAEGLAKIKKLMAIDQEYRFRSSFGIVPMRYYTDESVRRHITESGYGLYVHDLYHDGKLFKNYEIFHRRAQQVNDVLSEWGVDGFRAGAMHHNLDWIGELNVKYDMSTFDTDPFEPMPDGTATIFPFMAASSSTGRWYVEIPYTLPQDLMMFVLHPARTVDIWIKKLDWIIEHSGMVSVNVHPDYICFDEKCTSPDQYSVEKYREFLGYIYNRYRDVMWNPLPSELSDFIYNESGGLFHSDKGTVKS